MLTQKTAPHYLRVMFELLRKAAAAAGVRAQNSARNLEWHHNSIRYNAVNSQQPSQFNNKH